MSEPRWRVRGLLLIAAGIIGAGILAAALEWSGVHHFYQDDVQARALARRGRVALVSGRPWHSTAEGTELILIAESAPLAAVLRQPDGGDGDVGDALRAGGFDALLVDPLEPPNWATSDGLTALLASYGEAPGLVGRHLSGHIALYVPDPVAVIPRHQRDALATVARRILAGERPPRVQSFPLGLRAVEHVEVMVMLRSGPRPRLWRSARGSSIARAFLTAVRVAGNRWAEREQAMGGPLTEILPDLVVEVSLLQDDGELGTISRAFIDRVVSDQHGVAYDRKGAWRYFLPEATREHGGGSASVAFRQLLLDHGLPPDGLGRDEIRPYRMRVRRLAVSAATRDTPDPLAPVRDPSELVEAAAPR